MEEIRIITEAPRYGITQEGEVFNIKTERKMKPCIYKDGTITYTLRTAKNEKKKYTRRQLLLEYWEIDIAKTPTHPKRYNISKYGIHKDEFETEKEYRKAYDAAKHKANYIPHPETRKKKDTTPILPHLKATYMTQLGWRTIEDYFVPDFIVEPDE